MTAGTFLVGCSQDGQQRDQRAPATTQQSPATAPPPPDAVGRGAPQLRAELTALLADHTHQLAVLLGQTVGDGPEADGLDETRQALDETSAALAGRFGDLYGGRARPEFLGLWRDQIGLFEEHARATRRDDAAGVRRLAGELDAYRGELGTFLEGLNPELAADDVARELRPLTTSMLALVEVADREGDLPAAQLEVASRVPDLARSLAAGIAAEDPTSLPGDPVSPAADLRAALTAALADHVFLQAGAVTRGTLESPLARQAAAAVRSSTGDLADLLSTVYGSVAAEDFTNVWRARIAEQTAYAQGLVDRDVEAREDALAELDGLGLELGALFEGLDPDLPAARVVDALAPHTAAFLGAIRAGGSGSPETAERVAEAAARLPVLARTLSLAIAAQQPDRYPVGRPAPPRSAAPAGSLVQRPRSPLHM